MLAFLEDKENTRRKEREEELDFKRMELTMLQERQEEKMRLRREAEEMAREERRAFMGLMFQFIQNMNK